MRKPVIWYRTKQVWLKHFPPEFPASFSTLYQALKNGSRDFSDFDLIEMGLAKSLTLAGKTKIRKPLSKEEEEFVAKFKTAVSKWRVCRICIKKVGGDWYFPGYFYPDTTPIPPQVLINAMHSDHKQCFVKIIYVHVFSENKTLDDLILDQFNIKLNHLENLSFPKKLPKGYSGYSKDYWRDVVLKEGTALHIACRYGYHGYLRLLLISGANPDTDIANRLTEIQAPIQVVDINDNLQSLRTQGFQDTPLHMAAMFGRVECVKTLIQGRWGYYKPANANAFGRVYPHETPVYAAICSANQDCVMEIVKGLLPTNPWKYFYERKIGSANWKSPPDTYIDCVHHICSPLMAAVAWGKNGIVDRLLKEGASLHTRARITGETALHVAVHQGNVTALRILLHYGAPTSTRSCNGTTCIHYWTGSDYEILRVLLRHGADVNWKDGKGEGLIHKIAATNNRNMMERFFEAAEGTIDVDLPTDSNERTPLHTAAAHGATDCIDYLLHIGADAERVDKSGQNVLHIAASVGHFYRYSGSVLRIQDLISAGAKINQQDNMGDTPAHKAAQYMSNGPKCREMGRNFWKIIKGRANLAIKNNLGQTPSLTQESRAKKRKSEPASKVENAKRKRSRILKNRRKST